MPHNDATAMATAATASTASQKPVPRETVTRSKHVPREYECKKKEEKTSFKRNCFLCQLCALHIFRMKSIQPDAECMRNNSTKYIITCRPVSDRCTCQS